MALFMALSLGACGLFGPPQPIFTAEGRVVDADGRAVPGAVVTDFTTSTLTDEAGRFSFPVFHPLIAIAKPGHQPVRLTAEPDSEARVTLRRKAARETVALDSRWAGGSLEGLRRTLREAPVTNALYPGTPLSRLDVLVMVTPGRLSIAERGAIGGWVRSGGRLVLCGEWGGYGDQDIPTLNELAEPAGITFTGGTVKTIAGEQLALTVPRAVPGSLGRAVGEQPVSLYAASDLETRGAARPILTPGTRAYAVLAVGTAPVLAAVGPSGLGKVFALGDSTLWRDAEDEGAEVPHIGQGGNARLAAALIGW